jgi:hypothetical protein
MKNPRVPEKVTSPVKRLCNRIAPNKQPHYVKLLVEPGAIINDCFTNIESKIQRDGGSVQYGWAIWYLPGTLMEAEFHAVWLSPEGEPIDITPQSIPCTKILFLPDHRRKYTGRQVDNIRIPLNKNPKVKEFIKLHEAKFKIMNEGELANKHGLITVSHEKIEPIIRRLAELAIELGGL